jgi:hypothetical protein
MSNRISVVLFLASALCTGTAFAAATNKAPATASTSTAPVAFVYVASYYTGQTNRIVGYAAAPNGKLTPVPYSPFPHDVYSMAVNGKYLFASSNSLNDNVIYAFSMGPHGYLTLVHTTNISKLLDSTCAAPGELVLDHTGATLYPVLFNVDCSDDNAYVSLNVVQSTGALTYLSETGAANHNFFAPLTFIGNNKLVYSVDGGLYAEINGYRRESNGSLVDISIDVSFPPAPNNNSYYAPSVGAADPTNHLAVAMSLNDSTTFSPTTTVQLATFTANESNGNVTTNSTYENMPKVAVAGVNARHNSGVNDIGMAPSGKLLAVAGTTGLQIFHFNGADPITAYTSALTKDEINQVFWDNDNHLYATAPYTGKLFVFTVTPTSAVQAPGSPYNIPQPRSLIVQPK